MLIGTFILILSVIPLVFDFLYLARYKNYRQTWIGKFLVGITVLIITLAYGVFASAFLFDDFSLQAAYSYSSSALPVISKLYATWSGSGGSLLFLLLTISLVYTIYRFNSVKDRSRHDRVAYFAFDLTLIFLIALTLGKDPFAATGFAALEGQGLSPVLQSAWMAIHPPIVFFAYAFILLGFFLVTARIRTGEKHQRLLNASILASWFLMTLGIVLGAVWAYEVLGWGGYWSWDPIETGSLLPWLALTAYFFLHTVYKTKNQLLENIAVLAAAVSMFFVSALTRGGLLTSVHSYGLSPAGPLLLLFGSGLIFYFLHITRKPRRYHVMADWKSTIGISEVFTMSTLLLSFVVCFVGIAIPMIVKTFGVELTLGATFYEVTLYPLLILFTFGILGVLLQKVIGRRTFLATLCCLTIIGLIVAVMGWPTISIWGNFAFTLSCFGILATMYSVFLEVKQHKPIMMILSKSVIYAGLFILVVGVVFTQSAGLLYENSDAQPNSTISYDKVQVSLQSIGSGVSDNSILMQNSTYKEYTTIEVPLTVQYEGKSYSGILNAKLYPAYGLTSSPSVISVLNQDIYVHIIPTQSLYNWLAQPYTNQTAQLESFTLAVNIFPWISLVWFGSTLLIIGTILVVLVEVRRFPY